MTSSMNSSKLGEKTLKKIVYRVRIIYGSKKTRLTKISIVRITYTNAIV